MLSAESKPTAMGVRQGGWDLLFCVFVEYMRHTQNQSHKLMTNMILYFPISVFMSCVCAEVHNFLLCYDICTVANFMNQCHIKFEQFDQWYIRRGFRDYIQYVPCFLRSCGCLVFTAHRLTCNQSFKLQ